MFKKPTSQPISYALSLINNSPLSRARTFTSALHLEKGNALQQPKGNHTIKYTPPLTRSKSKQSYQQTTTTKKNTNTTKTNPTQTNSNPKQSQTTRTSTRQPSPPQPTTTQLSTPQTHPTQNTSPTTNSNKNHPPSQKNTTNSSNTKTNNTTNPPPNPKPSKHSQPALTSPSLPPTRRTTMTTETEDMLQDESPIVNTTNRGQPSSPHNTNPNTNEDIELGFDYSKILVKSNPNTPTQSPATTPRIPSWTYQSIEPEVNLKLGQLGKSLNTVAKLHHNREFMEMAMARHLPPRGMQLDLNCTLLNKTQPLKNSGIKSYGQPVMIW